MNDGDSHSDGAMENQKENGLPQLDANPFQAPAAIESDAPLHSREIQRDSAVQGCLLGWLVVASLMGSVVVFIASCFGTFVALDNTGTSLNSGLVVAVSVGLFLGVGSFSVVVLAIGRHMRRSGS